MNSAPIITLTTDFGTADTYVAAMKGVILSHCPNCIIIDITHEINPQDVTGATLALSGVYTYYPSGTIHVAVVDPGVGSTRRPLLVTTEKYAFIGPDNSIFSFALAGRDLQGVFMLENRDYMLHDQSATFHGRDIFAPAAAHLAGGARPETFGRPVQDYRVNEIPRPVMTGDTHIRGEVIHIDRFGNLITNINRQFLEKLSPGGPLVLTCGNASISLFVHTYAEAPEGTPCLLFGSNGQLEIAVKNSNAQKILKASRGDTLHIKKAE